MKALKILLDERKQQLDIFEQNKELGNPNENNYIVILNEAIKELEDLQNRTCENCLHKKWCDIVVADNKKFYCSDWESK